MLHSLASGARATELKDPTRQVLRVLDYSRISRHLLMTACDDGSVHLWDTTGRNPKMSWLKQHSVPTSGAGFSPSHDKVIASWTRSCTYLTRVLEGLHVASLMKLLFLYGTSNGCVVFYDMRGKPQPLTVLHAHGEAVTNLCWQRSEPVIVNENSSTPETVPFRGVLEDSVLMPDPVRSASSVSTSTMTSLSRNSGRSGPSPDSFSILAGNGTSTSGTPGLSRDEQTPVKSGLWTGGPLSRLHAPRPFNIKDDMEVFSPLVEVELITPSIDKFWDDHDVLKKDHDKKLLFPSSRRFTHQMMEAVIYNPCLTGNPLRCPSSPRDFQAMRKG